MQLCRWTNEIPQMVESAQTEQNYANLWVVYSSVADTLLLSLIWIWSGSIQKRDNKQFKRPHNDEKIFPLQALHFLVCSRWATVEFKSPACFGMFWLAVLHNAVSLNLNERALSWQNETFSGAELLKEVTLQIAAEILNKLSGRLESRPETQDSHD